MLRPIKSSYIRPRLLGFHLSNSGTPSVSDGCKDDVASVTDNGTGDSTIAFYEGFQRACLAVASPMGASGAMPSISAVAAGSVRVLTNNSAGSGTDMGAQVLVLGYDSAETQRVVPNYHQVRAGRLKPVLIGASVSVGGTVQSGKQHVSCSLAGSTYTFTLTNPFQTAPVVVATCRGSFSGVARVTSVSATGFVINTYDDTGSDQGFSFDLFILGWYSKEYARAHRAILQTPQLGARLIALEIDYTGGVPAITVGSDEASISDDGTGDFTLTWAEAFKRRPEVIAVPNGTGYCTSEDAPTTTAATIYHYDNAGNAADPDKVYVFALGYDSEDEF